MREAPVRVGGWAREARAFLELFAISGLAVAQPTLDLLTKNARLLIVWQANTFEAIALAVVIVLAPATVSWMVEALVGTVLPRFRPVVHWALIGAWFGVVGLEVVKHQTSLGSGVMVVIGIVVAIGMGAATARVALLRTWLRFLAVAPVGFLVLFVAASPATPVIFGDDPTAKRVTIGNPKRVVMIVLDELPLESLLDGRGSIDSELFPHLARLAADATLYRNETTVSPSTEAAVPAMVSGLMPTDSSAVPSAAAHPDTLFTLLGAEYDLNVHESVTRLCPVSLCPPTRVPVGVHLGFSGMLRDVATIWRDFARPSRVAQNLSSGIGGLDIEALRSGEQFVRSLEPTRSRPRLDYLHVLLPHFPWHYLPTGQDYAAFPPLPAGHEDGVWFNQAAADVSRTKHLLQLQAADALVGQIITRLETLNAYEESVIVVTADHGVAFRSGSPFRGVARSTYPSIMWTPLIIKAADQASGTVDDRPALAVDILPTIAEMLDVRVPWKMAGRPLTGAPRREGPRPLFRWSSNVVEPGAGSDLIEFDGGRGFRTVIKRSAAPPGGPVGLRVFRRVRFGALIGTSAWDLAALGPPVATATIDDPLRYQVVDATASKTPWATMHGRVTLPKGRTVALAANGTVVAVFTTQAPVRDGSSDFYGMVAPLLQDGENLIQLFEVDGTPEEPRLQSIEIVPT